MDTLEMLITVIGADMYAGGDLETGLWLDKLTYIYYCTEEKGHEIIIAGPKDGNVPAGPESLKPMVLDKLSKEHWGDPEFRNELRHVENLNRVAGELFNCIYLAGGHDMMYDFPNNITLQTVIREYYEHTKIVAAICRGVSGLLNVKLSNGEYLIEGKRFTGFSWFEKSIIGREKEIPFNLEAELKGGGADYEKASAPMTSGVVVDYSLITGENPFSSKEMAEVVIQQLKWEK